MRKAIIIAAVATFARPALAQEPPLALKLICSGAGQQVKADVDTATMRRSDGSWATATMDRSHDVGFSDDVRVEIAGDAGRVRIPIAMLPPIRGGDNGWFKLREVAATPDDITAIATINMLNKAKLRIDRTTGLLSMTVLQGTFQGRCVPLDPTAPARAF